MRLIRWIARATLCLGIASLLVAPAGTPAEQQRYTLEIPHGQTTTFKVPFNVEHPGKLLLYAHWSGSRPLSFRVTPPAGTGSSQRRTSPSPMRFSLSVGSEQTGPWTLTIHALPLRGACSGQLTIELPESTAMRVRDRPPTAGESTTARRDLEAWQQPRQPVASASAAGTLLFRTTESFRALLIEAESRAPDSCRWQDDLLRWLAVQRDRSLDEGLEPAVETGKLMARFAAAIREVDALRSSDDPIIVGPAPTDRKYRAGWLRLRASRLVAIERELDDLLMTVRRNHAPELAGQTWPLRMVSCLTASERYFDQRWILGADEAPNRDLARAQWLPLREAAGALAAMAMFGVQEPIRLGSPQR